MACLLQQCNHVCVRAYAKDFQLVWTKEVKYNIIVMPLSYLQLHLLNLLSRKTVILGEVFDLPVQQLDETNPAVQPSMFT